MKKPATYECSNCGSNAKVIRCRKYQFRESGLDNVVLKGITVIKCPKCKNVDPVIPRINDLMRSLAIAVVAKPYRLKGAEVRFLRKYLHMNGEEFARLIHVDRTHLSKWENDEDRVGDQSDRLIRAIALGLGEGLKEKIEQTMRSFPRIAETRDVQIDMNCRDMSYRYATA